MFRKTGREDQGWWRGRLDEAPTRHLQVGGKDPWSANVNQLIGDFKDVVVICYYEERELQPDPEYCREVVRCSEDFEAFIRELDVSPRVLTPQDVDGVEAGIDLEFTCRYNIHSGQTRLHFPPDSTYGADWLRLHVTHHRDRGWEFLVENKRDLKGSSLNEQEAATLARPPRLIVPAEGALAYSMDDVRRIVEGLPSTERFAFRCDFCRAPIFLSGPSIDDDEHPTARFRCAECGRLHDDDLKELSKADPDDTEAAWVDRIFTPRHR